MKKIILIAALAFALAACGQMPWANHGTSTSTATTSTTVGKTGDASGAKPGDGAQPAAAQDSGAKPDDNYSLVGLWGDNGDCKQYNLMRENGTFHSYTGGEGRWTLAGDQLTLSGANGSFSMGVRWIDADHVDLVNPNGAVGHSQRCPDNGVE